LWLLVVLAVFASGSLSAAVTAKAGALTGARVAASGVVLMACVVLAARVMFALERARRRAVSPNRRSR
jgi:apolipoprotein N-acyltransferase